MTTQANKNDKIKDISVPSVTENSDIKTDEVCSLNGSIAETKRKDEPTENVSGVLELDIYDFDKTMIPFDSGSMFWAYCLLHYPWIISCMPYQFLGIVLYFAKVFDLTQMKKPFFSFINLIPTEKAVRKFWDKFDKYIFDWAKQENRERYSVLISASPDFLVGEIAKRIGIDDWMSTRHDKHGTVIGKNCHDVEKVRRFREKYPDAKVINVYSDSIKNDKYIFSLAQHCFNAIKGRRIPFDFSEMYPEG